MGGGKWIWIAAVLCTLSASAQSWRDKELNFTECWNYGKNKSVFEAPVFSLAEDNLSFDGCGTWNRSDGNNKTTPWTVFLVDPEGSYQESVLLSDQTIISEAGFNKRKDSKIFGGACVNQTDTATCFEGRGLLSQKVLEVTKVEGKHGRFFTTTVLIWRIEKVQFSPTLQPVCLWNGDNQNDEHEIFYDNLFAPEAKCYSYRTIQERECDLYGNSICTGREGNQLEYLYNERDGRFFLRAIWYFSEHNGKRFVLVLTDLLPFMSQIVAATVDLAWVPKTPESKTKTNFQSFPGCGFATGPASPWHATLTLQTDPKYFWAATFISKRALVTAAHLLIGKDGKPLKANDVVVKLGTQNSSQLQVSKIVLHPGYNVSRGDLRDDVAIVILSTEVQLSDEVRPICLWNDVYQLDKIVNRTGSVWSSSKPEVLQETRVQVVSHQECFNNDRSFFSTHLRPTENFCVGFPTNQSGVCVGEGGEGFSLYDEISKRNFLRGVAILVNDSEGSKGDVRGCNPKRYTLVADVTNYIAWIVDNTPDI
ncbi:uncharacterized protein LOC132193919 [Neocloeon triangulifer]|uniref:uncharacterized protein LOC132193919 n=1 Tax=Neocloeon triangulifer TaxID=2078957 RepID=UPI00286F5B24|nr:uncharacterized protein LOC132193919 [Neocloeon triangulifer]